MSGLESMGQGINNPTLILETFDGFLRKPIDLIIYGRSAIALGFNNPDPSHQSTLDVDAILPTRQLDEIRHNDDFWGAQEKTNDCLQGNKLYFTHLFREEDVILTPDWESKKVKIEMPLKHIRLFRPATVDLILTKMMRDDEQDLADIKFMIEQQPHVTALLPSAMENARLPDVPEIRDIFARVKLKVLGLLQQVASS